MGLKPCPFCGGEGKIVKEGPKYFVPICTECPVEFCEIYFTKEEAAEAWNDRADQPNEPLTLDELRQMDGEPVWLAEIKPTGHCKISRIAHREYLQSEEVGAFDFESYGRAWLAYRRKPEEKKKNV